MVFDKHAVRYNLITHPLIHDRSSIRVANTELVRLNSPLVIIIRGKVLNKNCAKYCLVILPAWFVVLHRYSVYTCSPLSNLALRSLILLHLPWPLYGNRARLLQGPLFREHVVKQKFFQPTRRRARDLELNKTSLFIGTKPRRRCRRKLKPCTVLT